MKVFNYCEDYEKLRTNYKSELLKDSLNSYQIAYKYLKDETAVCTKQACSFRDHYDKFLQKNVEVLGISFDNKKSHRQFIEKFNLPFQLLSDINTNVATKYGVYGEKVLYGRNYMSIYRTTFLIDEDGIIEHVFKKVRPAYHAKDVLKLL